MGDFSQNQMPQQGWEQQPAPPQYAQQPAQGQVHGASANQQYPQQPAQTQQSQAPYSQVTGPQWEAYRQAVYAAASVADAEFQPGDPRAAVPLSLRPGRHKVHHSYIWLGGGLAAAAVIFVIIINLAGEIGALAADAGGLVLTAVMALVALAIVGIVLLVQWLGWKNLSYEITPTEFSMHSGIISKKHRHIPYQRVQSVNQNAGVLQRLAGVCTVKIDTAGGAANDSARLAYVRNSDAEALRAELFRRKKVLLAGGSIDALGNAYVDGYVVPSAWMAACSSNSQALALAVLGANPDGSLPGAAHTGVVAGQQGVNAYAASQGNLLDGADAALGSVRGVFGGAEVATGVVSYETGLSNKELMLAALSGSAGSMGAYFIAFLALLGSVTPLLMMLLGSGVAGAAAPVVIVMGGLFTVLFFVAIAVIAQLIQYGGFKVRRRENRIEVEHGLLQHVFSGVDIDRVQSVIIKQSLIRRIIGYCELSLGKIDAGASDGNDANVSRALVIHPFVKVERVPEILGGVIPEFSNVPAETVRPAPCGLRRAIVRQGFITNGLAWTALAMLLVYGVFALVMRLAGASADSDATGIMMTIMAIVLALAVVVAIVRVVNAVLWFRRSALGYNHDFMRITNGGLSVHTVMFPRKKIQYGWTRQNPFQVAQHVKSVYARTAAGVGGTTEMMWDLSDEQAEAWMEWVRPRGNAGY